jgi:sortase A
LLLDSSDPSVSPLGPSNSAQAGLFDARFVFLIVRHFWNVRRVVSPQVPTFQRMKLAPGLHFLPVSQESATEVTLKIERAEEFMRKFQKPAQGDLGSPSGAGQSPKRGRNLWIWTERVLLASGLVVLVVYGAARIESVLSSRAALKRFAELESSSVTVSRTSSQGKSSSEEAVPSEEASAAQDLDSPEVDFSLWDGRRVQAYKDSLAAQTGAPLGVLRVSKIHLEVPLLDGTDDLTLNHAVGRIAGTARPGEQGNIGIAGHRDGFFRGLKDVGVGDAIELKTLKGTETYVVDRIQIVTPRDVSVLQPRSVPSLTLVTCYPFYYFGSAPKRYIVTASLAREIQSGSENSTLSPLSATSSSKRRNNE